MHTRNSYSAPVKWISPTARFWKTNTDASFGSDSHKAGFGAAVHDWEGNFIARFSLHSLDCFNVFAAKATTLLEGLSLLL